MVDLLKALAHPVRLRILALLREGELCVCQIKALVDLSNSSVSEHLGELRRAGLLEERKKGRWVYYRLQPQAELEAHLDALWPSLMVTDQVIRDLSASKEIRKIPIEVTCRNSKSCKTPMKVAIQSRGTTPKEVQP